MNLTNAKYWFNILIRSKKSSFSIILVAGLSQTLFATDPRSLPPGATAGTMGHMGVWNTGEATIFMRTPPGDIAFNQFFWNTDHPLNWSFAENAEFYYPVRSFQASWREYGPTWSNHGFAAIDDVRTMLNNTHLTKKPGQIGFSLACASPHTGPTSTAWTIAQMRNEPTIGVSPWLTKYNSEGQIIDFPVLGVRPLGGKSGPWYIRHSDHIPFAWRFCYNESGEKIPFNKAIYLFRGGQTPPQKIDLPQTPWFYINNDGQLVIKPRPAPYYENPVMTNLGKGYGKAQCSEPKPVPFVTRIGQNINNASQNTVRVFSGAGRAITGAGGAFVKTMGPDIVGGVLTGGLESAGVSPPVAGLVGIGGTLIATAGVEGTLGPAVSYLGAKGTLAIAGTGGGGVLTTAVLVLGGSLFGAACWNGVEHQCQEEIKAMKKNGISGPAALGNFHGSKW